MFFLILCKNKLLYFSSIFGEVTTSSSYKERLTILSQIVFTVSLLSALSCLCIFNKKDKLHLFSYVRTASPTLKFHILTSIVNLYVLRRVYCNLTHGIPLFLH